MAVAVLRRASLVSCGEDLQVLMHAYKYAQREGGEEAEGHVREVNKGARDRDAIAEGEQTG